VVELRRCMMRLLTDRLSGKQGLGVIGKRKHLMLGDYDCSESVE
jgi:hypothetical protein